MKRNYDIVAGVYDKLAKLFIGTALREAQVHFLQAIPANAAILIVGGGTGWILEEIAKIHHQGLQIDYVDYSAKMIALAKRRNSGKNSVRYIQQSILDFSNDSVYDVIITPFLLDNFKEETMQKVFFLLHQKLNTRGLWLHTDFQIQKKSSYWQKAILFVMYSFFRIACNIEAKRLPDVVACFNKYQYHLTGKKTFLHQFIITSIYQKLKADS